ncbi:kinase-like protein [Schizopora paradoxa]|uniref:Kinase-like protein n=1 Tax=Schizopora paradoxa TaxID=27342 RepID=A0A0H2RYL0_9AGAM|nr:kinase-like protein [Schizopora paradoxa]
MTSLEKRRAMSESRVLDISALLKPLRRDPVAGGSFGDVFQYSHSDGRLCAVKSLRPFAIDTQGDPRSLIRAIFHEAQQWHDLTHPNILPMIGVCFRDETGFPSLVCPWMKNGDARKYCEKPQNREKLDFIKFISKIAYGLAYIHSRGIVHGDIRGPNILINDDGEPCISDLGFARVVNVTATSSYSSSDSKWPPANVWSPPEYYPGLHGPGGIKPEKSADVFSYGATVIELWTGRNPFPEFASTLEMILHFMAKKPLPDPPQAGQKEFLQFKDQVHEVYLLCCDIDPKSRSEIATIAHLLGQRVAQHDFIKKEDDEVAAMLALRPPGHSKQDDDGVSMVSYASSTVAPRSEPDDENFDSCSPCSSHVRNKTRRIRH